jgi:M6 family metalloprotease-like protein
MVLQTPWAILLCKFKDDQSEPPVPNFRTICERFFATPSAGYNAYQFFWDMSHGNIDISGSKVLGWFTIEANVSDALPPRDPPPPGWIPRKDQAALTALAKQAAINAGVDMNRFFATVLIMNLMTGWAQGQGSLRAVWADWRRIDCRNFNGSLGARGPGGGNGTECFGQEMGHAYGLNHSYREGSNVQYQDPWDIMSSWANTYSATDLDYAARGPGLNAWNMRSRNWLDESRVWRPPDTYAKFDGSVQLRPLHRHNLAGYLAAEIPAFDDASSEHLFEFRLKSGWDEEIPRSTVLIHTFENGHSVIMRVTPAQYDLAIGVKFERRPYVSVEVTSIDEASQTATLRIVYRPDKTKECNDLKNSIAALDMEIRHLQREYDIEEDFSRKQQLQLELREKRFERYQLSRRFRDIGCTTIV